MTLYERLCELCQEKGIKGARMCSDIGLSKSLMTDLKMGRKNGVSAVTAQKIASYFGVTVGYLLGEEEKEEKPVTKDELSDSRTKLIELAKSVPEDKVDLFLRVMQSIVEAE